MTFEEIAIITKPVTRTTRLREVPKVFEYITPRNVFLYTMRIRTENVISNTTETVIRRGFAVTPPACDKKLDLKMSLKVNIETSL